MGARYFTKPSTTPPAGGPVSPSGGYWNDEGLVLTNLSVPEHTAADTGLIDMNGKPIMRAPNAMGFIWPR